MAILFAKKSHSWSARATENWTTDGGTTYQTPTTGDTLVTNNFTVTIDETTEVMGELKNGATTSGGYTSTAGGKFTISGSNTLKTTAATIGTATLIDVASGSTGILECDTLTGSTTTNVPGSILMNQTGTYSLTITGIGGSAGTYTGGTYTMSDRYGTIHIENGTPTLTITGNCVGGIAAYTSAIYAIAACSIVITGNVIGGSGNGANSNGVRYNSTGTIIINGNCIGGSGAGSNCIGAFNLSTGTITINGNSTGGNGIGYSPGAYNNSTGTITINGAAIGNDVGPDAPNSTYAANVGLYNNTRNLTCTAKAFITGKYGCPATGGYGVLLAEDTDTHANNYVKMYKANGTDFVYFEDPDLNGDYPATANVRNNTTYAGGSRTGSLVVPPSTAVASGVATDATVGSAVLTEAAVTTGVWDATRSGHTTTGTFGEFAYPGILSRAFPRSI